MVAAIVSIIIITVVLKPMLVYIHRSCEVSVIGRYLANNVRNSSSAMCRVRQVCGYAAYSNAYHYHHHLYIKGLYYNIIIIINY